MNTLSPPEQGQLVQIINRFFLVQDINTQIIHDTKNRVHKLTLERIDDDRLDDTLELIWETELNKSVHSDIGFPT